ncbi:hypothetical protein [[Eubacterium] cellulosolvens]
MNISPNLKQKVRLFLHSYIGDFDSWKIQEIYISLIDKSKDLTELDESVKKTNLDAKTKGDDRFLETLQSLHEKIKNNYL